MGQGSSLLAEEQQSLLAFTSETPVAFDSELWLSLFRFKVREIPSAVSATGSAGSSRGRRVLWKRCASVSHAC